MILLLNSDATLKKILAVRMVHISEVGAHPKDLKTNNPNGMKSMMLKFLLFLLIFIAVLSCSDREIFSRNEVLKLADVNVNDSLPSRYGLIELFVYSDTDSLIITNTVDLNAIYNSRFSTKYPTYAKFLGAVLNQRETIPVIYFKGSEFIYIKLRKDLEETYRNIGFDAFFRKYTIRKGNRFHLRQIDSFDAKMSIAYFLYLNGYHTSHDDVSGSYSVLRRDSLIQ